MQRHRLTRYLALIGFIAAVPMEARAQAFGINEIGSCAATRAFAVTGSPCQDASAIFWNPGFAATQKGWNAIAGMAAIMVGGSFTQDTTFRKYDADIPTAIVPHAFVSYRPDKSKFAYGLGFYVPYGLTSQWTDSFPGRFQAKKAALATIYVQPNVAYQINDKWSVGGGPVLGHSTVELIQSLDLADQAVTGTPLTFRQLGIAQRTEFAQADLNGSATGFGAHIGLYGRPNERWTVGVRFLTPVEFTYDGAEATFTQKTTGLILARGNPISPTTTVDMDALLAAQFATGGKLVAQGVETKITHPAQVQAGVGYTGFANWLVSLDYAWVGWRRFKELPVTFLGAANGSNRALIEDYNNSSAIRVGAQRTFPGNGAQLRFGYSGVASAAPDETVTPLLPEQDRAYGAFGGSYPITKMLTVEAGYLRVFAPGKRGRIVERASRNQTATSLNTGKFELSANVLTFSLKANY